MFLFFYFSTVRSVVLVCDKCKKYAVLIISTAPELMKLIFAVLDVSLTMGLTRCYKTEGFFTFIFAVFTALHAMQTRSSDENSVRLSVCPSVRPSVRLSHACIVTKR